MDQRGLLLFTTIFLLCSCVLLLGGLYILGFSQSAFTKGTPKKTSSPELCTTKACVDHAATLLNNMDVSVDPCDNFYKFVCGGYEANTAIPQTRNQLSTFSVMYEKVDEQIHRILSQPIEYNEPKFSKLAKKFYQSCMNTDEIEKRGLEPLYSELKKLGGWPVVDGDAWNESAFSWTELVYRFREYGYMDNYFIEVKPLVDKKNATRKMIYVDQPPTGVGRAYLTRKLGLDEPEVKAYRDYQIDIAIALGADPTRAKKEMYEAAEFERKLGNLSLTAVERENVTRMYNPATLRELQEKYPVVPWVEYINRLIPPDSGVTVDENEVIIVAAPEYFEGFEEIMRATDKRTMANYAMWRAIASSVGFLSENIRKFQLNYMNIATGTASREERWKECVLVESASVGSALGNAIGALYVRNYFKDEDNTVAKEMVADIRDAFLESLREINWMDPTTRMRAIEKANSMYTQVGYAPELLNDTILDDFYSKLEFSSTDYFGNINNLTKFSHDDDYATLRDTVNLTDWRTHGKPAEVNAYYASFENSIEFPSAILQGVFYNTKRPKYTNYGAIGMVMGHEITHGFDVKGSQFDINGNWNNWWEPKTKEAYNERLKCIIDQYNHYNMSEVDLHIYGELTQGENVADNGGLKNSYRAYQAWVKRNEPEPLLPGLEKYNQSQLFFISMGNVWCSKFTKAALKLRVLTNVHPPGQIRANGAISNFPEFSKEFNCPLGTNMNPVKKCYVW